MTGNPHTNGSSSEPQAALEGVRPGIPYGGGRRYWRSLGEKIDSDEFRAAVLEKFPSIGGLLNEDTSRRSVLKWMAASFALAGVGGMAGCIRWPKAKILPFTGNPAGRIPGRPVKYATCLEVGGVAQPVLVSSFDGRPIKVDGNPLHPQSLGGSNAWLQASVLDLYDPMRVQGVAWIKGAQGSLAPQLEPTDWITFRKSFEKVRSSRGARMAVLSPPTSSTTVLAARAQLPNARFFEWDPLTRDNEREGCRLVFGKAVRIQFHPARADLIVSFDSDFLMTHPESLRMAREFAARRRADDPARSINRLRVAESFYSITGAAADERIVCRARDVAILVAQVGHALVAKGLKLPPACAALSSVLEKGARLAKLEGAERIADDLLAHRGKSLITVGSRQPVAVHALAALLNAALDNCGADRPVTFLEEAGLPDRPAHGAQLRELVRGLEAGEFDTLLILEGNPVYDAPVDLDFAGCLSRSRAAKVRLSAHVDETSALCDWQLPAAHYLESWGDARSYDGRISIVQPLIEPIHGGRTPAEVLAMLAEEQPRPAESLVRFALAGTLGAGSDVAVQDAAWRRALHDGVIEGTGFPAARLGAGDARGGWEGALGTSLETAAQAGMEAVFAQDYKVYDGRFGNNGWLHELPDPMTKLAWDNAAILGVKKAHALGVENGDLVEIRVAGASASMRMPVFVLPGQEPESVTLHLGFGRNITPPPRQTPKMAGAVSYNRHWELDASLCHGSSDPDLTDSVGFDVQRLRSTQAFEQASLLVQIARVPGQYPLACAQQHHPIDLASSHLVRWGLGNFQHQRAGELARMQHIADYREHPEGIRHYTHLPEKIESLWMDREYEGHRWGMAIDLSTCIGCSACVVACQAENNTAVTGKKEVAKGREMHWIRIDRYFSGDDEDAPRVIHQPVACQQCENAPCEQVCPVAATVHSEEGLNDMVYNRCVGTRYCSNNCPYKVRRFNYFNNFKDLDSTATKNLDREHPTRHVEAMVYNPEVTIRHRGVMEKCTFCVQRITVARIAARNEGRALRDGEVTTACMDACPTSAIAFGDLSDASSRVAELHKRDRSYKMLEELNVRPRNAYLAKLVNSDERLIFTPRNPGDRHEDSGASDSHGAGIGGGH